MEVCILKESSKKWRVACILLFALSGPCLVNLKGGGVESKDCGSHLEELVDTLTGTYFYRMDYRRKRLRKWVISEVNKRILNLDEEPIRIEDVDSLVYQVFRDYEVERDRKLPVRAYVLLTAAWVAPFVTTGAAYFFLPKDSGIAPLVGILSTFLSGKFLDPLGAVLQEKTNARLKRWGTYRPSIFRTSHDIATGYNKYLDGANERVTTAQSPWAEAGDGKLRAIEVIIRLGLGDSLQAYKEGDVDRSVGWAALVAIDYMVRWPYLSPKERSLSGKIQMYFTGMDRKFRDKLQAKILSNYDPEQSPELTVQNVTQLLDAWLPHTRQRPEVLKSASAPSELPTGGDKPLIGDK